MLFLFVIWYGEFHPLPCFFRFYFLQEYFLKYGYMNLGRATMASGLDTQLTLSVKRLQKLAGLEQNGDLLDPSTLALLDKSRCGQPDTPDGTQARFAVQGSRWGKQVSYSDPHD